MTWKWFSFRFSEISLVCLHNDFFFSVNRSLIWGIWLHGMAVPSMVGRSKIFKLFVLNFFICKMRKQSLLLVLLWALKEIICVKPSARGLSPLKRQHVVVVSLGDAAKEGGPENHISERTSASLPNGNVLLESPPLSRRDNLYSGKWLISFAPCLLADPRRLSWGWPRIEVA